MNKSKFRLQVYSAEEFYNLYDNPTDNFKELVQANRDYFHPTNDLYEDIRKEPQAIHIVAFSTNTNKALSHVGVQSLSTDTDTGTVLYIFHVFTLESYRRQGIVTYIIKSLQRQRTKLGLRVDSANRGAIHLYEQLGFIQGPTGVYTTDDDTDIEYVYEPVV